LSRVPTPLLQSLRGGSEDESSSPPPPPPIDQNDGHIEVETGPRDFDDEVEDVSCTVGNAEDALKCYENLL
jgi:hypothetical protein